MDVGTNESFLKLKFSQEIINNGEKCGWLKQMRAADEKHVSNKWWPNYVYTYCSQYVMAHSYIYITTS